MAKSKKTLRKKKLAMRQPTWTTGTGSKIPVFKMETSHVLNVCRFLRKAKYIIKIDAPNDPPYSLPYCPSDWGKKKIGLFLLDAMIDEYERRRIDPACIEEERGPFRILSGVRIEEENMTKGAVQFKEMLERRPFPLRQKKNKTELGLKITDSERDSLRSLTPIQRAENTLEYLSKNQAKIQSSRSFLTPSIEFDELVDGDMENGESPVWNAFQSSQLTKTGRGKYKPKGRFEAIAEVIKEEEPKQVSEAEVKLDPRFKNILVDEDKVSNKTSDNIVDQVSQLNNIETVFMNDISFLVEQFNTSSLGSKDFFANRIEQRIIDFKRAVPYEVTMDSNRDIFKQTTQFVIEIEKNGDRFNLLFFELII